MPGRHLMSASPEQPLGRRKRHQPLLALGKCYARARISSEYPLKVFVPSRSFQLLRCFGRVSCVPIKPPEPHSIKYIDILDKLRFQNVKTQTHREISTGNRLTVDVPARAAIKHLPYCKNNSLQTSSRSCVRTHHGQEI